MRRIFTAVAILLTVIAGQTAYGDVLSRPKGDSRFRDLSLARQPLPSAELDNEFNTVKNFLNNNVLITTQNISEWALFQNAPLYVSTTQFTVPGNATDLLHVDRAIRADLNGTLVYSRIAATSYSGLTYKTTVTLDDAVLTLDLSMIYYGLISADGKSQPDTNDIITKGPWVDVRAFGNLSTAKAYAKANNKPLEIYEPQTCTSVSLSGVILGYVAPGAFTNCTVTGLKDEAWPEWFGVTGTNDEVPINKAITSLSAYGGRVILSQTYDIETNPVLAASGVAITAEAPATIGVGGTHIHGGWLHNKRATGGAIVIGDLLHNVEISKIGFRGEAAIVPGVATGQDGIEFIVATSTRNVVISQNNFYQIDKGIYVNDPGGDKDVSGVVIEKNQANEVNTFVHSKSNNFESKILDNDINYLQYGLFLERANLTLIQGNISGGAAGTADSTFIRAGYLGILNVISNNAEQCVYPFYMDASWSPGAIYPINFIGNTFTGPLTFASHANARIASVNMMGNHFWNGVEVVSGQVFIESIHDTFYGGSGFVLAPATNSMITRLVTNNITRYNVTGDDDQSDAIAKEVQLTTTNDTTVASLIPWNNAGVNTQAYKVSYYYFVNTAATNVRIHLTWSDPLGAHDVDLVANAEKATGSYSGTFGMITAINGGTAIPIALKVTAGTANNVYVTAVIEPVTY